MPNPLLFLLVVVVIDFFLKAKKNKKKMEDARRSNMGEVDDRYPASPKKPTRTGPMMDLRRMLEEELEKQNQAKVEDRQSLNKTMEATEAAEKRMSRDISIEEQRKKVDRHSELEKMKRRKEERDRDRQISRDGYNNPPVEQAFIATSQEDKDEFKQDILKGIIFSEILGKPKSLRK